MDDLIREMVIKKLIKAGWIIDASVASQDAPRKQVTYSLGWTRYGWDRRRLLFELFSELGYESGYRGGELEELHSLIRIHPDEAPPSIEPTEGTRF